MNERKERIRNMYPMLKYKRIEIEKNRESNNKEELLKELKNGDEFITELKQMLIICLSALIGFSILFNITWSG